MKVCMHHFPFHKVYAQWVPRLLTDERKNKRFERTFAFLQRCQKEGKVVLDTIVTGGETWIQHFSPESKCSSLQWKHSTFPTETRCRTVSSVGKEMMTLFFDSTQKVWSIQS
ncbi:histone-lysine N-methyltransferase SETMAR [Nephila pilipes]|uniref:Histone-lysine N-methyltransferase SETMAR n=1 Tax=Nephila pilipes TaxID=299642 RepID=A0A8X6T523_NEPPI|nr:histone-lysine N-methyltransferase SETMAR [Nephila pilipes]